MRQPFICISYLLSGSFWESALSGECKCGSEPAGGATSGLASRWSRNHIRRNMQDLHLSARFALVRAFGGGRWSGGTPGREPLLLDLYLNAAGRACPARGSARFAQLGKEARGHGTSRAFNSGVAENPCGVTGTT